MRKIVPIFVIIVVISLVWTSGCTNKTPITNQTSTVKAAISGAVANVTGGK
ncbi:MAG: hypothetical protein NTV10_00240 [Methanoregula sp.]|nr:hypothetical protein [Methanoregula sp.]